MKNKRILSIVIAGILAIGATVTGVMAASINTGPMIELSDAIKAADVCETHLEQYCDECHGYGLDASYAVYCPHCNTKTTLCCSRDCAVDDNEANCYVNTHASGCKTIQDLYWNAYICMNCGWYTIGTHSDDYHVEAYWHLKDSTCYDHAYCSKQTLDDLRAIVNADTGVEVMSVAADAEIATTSVDDTEYDPVAAGDYCEIHDVFACEIPHNDVE